MLCVSELGAQFGRKLEWNMLELNGRKGVVNHMSLVELEQVGPALGVEELYDLVIGAWYVVFFVAELQHSRQTEQGIGQEALLLVKSKLSLATALVILGGLLEGATYKVLDLRIDLLEWVVPYAIVKSKVQTVGLVLGRYLTE